MFAAWNGPHVTPNNLHFNLKELLLRAIEQEEAIASGDDDIDSESDGGPTKPPPAVSPSSPPTLRAADRRRTRKKSQSHRNRASQRQKVREGSFSHHQPRPEIYKKYISTAVPILTPMAANAAGVASTAYVALDDRTRSSHVYTLSDVVGEGARLPFKLQTWDGR